MKSLYVLTIALSLTQASILGPLSPESQGKSLVRRIGGEWGNKPGERGYDYREDPNYRRNGGRYSSDELKNKDAYKRRDARDPPSSLQPAYEPSSSRSRPRTEYATQEIRPERQEQVKKTRKLSYTDAKEYSNGDVWAREFGASLPFPKQGPAGYTKFVGGASVGPDILSGGRVGVTTAQQAGTKFGLGPLFVDTSYTTSQNLNPAPAPREQVVDRPYSGAAPNSYYIHSRQGGNEPVYMSRDGILKSENSRKPIKDGHSRTVYLNNGGGRRRSKRSPANVLGQIETTTNAPANDSESLAADWQSYYTIYNSLRTNATNLLMPIFENLVKESNTSYAYEMAWSIHSQLTGSPNEYQGGYYQNGLANFANFTDNWLLMAGYWLDSNGQILLPQNSSIRTDNSTLLKTVQMLGANDYLEQTYYKTWNASVAALNVTQNGSPNTLLNDLVYYSAVVTSTNDTNVLSANFYQLDLPASEAEAAWFLDGLNKYS